MSRTNPSVAIPTSFILLGVPRLVAACGVCWGDPDAGITRGAKLAIGILLGVVIVVLTVILRTVRSCRRRAAALAELGETA